MGLDASVMCRCLADGKIALPKFAGSVHVDADGYLALDAPDEKGALHMRFHDWMSNACQHPRMLFAREHIGNWTSYRSFQQALGIAGWQHFPALKSELPQSNGGLTQADAAKTMLDELDYFEREGDLGSTTELIDCATGNALHEYIETYDGIFGYGPDGIARGVDPNGFFVRKRTEENEAEIFRSMRFSQTLIDGSAASNALEPSVEYADLATGKTIRCSYPIVTWKLWPDGRLQNDRGHFNPSFPAELQVMRRKRTAADFEYVVNQLRKVCRASVETGNPIRWS